MPRRNWGGWKSVLHFDFPHYFAPSSGLKDEASQEAWHLSGNAALASRYLPADESNSNAPKFGYRCLITHSAQDFAQGSNSHGTFTFTTANGFSAGIFVCPLSSSEGGIITLMNGENSVLSLTLSADRKIKASCASWSLGSAGTSVLSLDTWHYVFMAAKTGTFNVWVDGKQEISATSPGADLKVSAVRIGGCPAMFDEFSWGIYSQSYAVLSEPLQASLDITEMGGFGTGNDGAFSWTASSGVRINTAGKINAVSGLSMSVSSWNTAQAGAKNISAGDELMFHVRQKGQQDPYALSGLYDFARVTAITGASFTVDREISAFRMDEAVRDYNVIACKVPNFSSFSITAGYLIPTEDIIAFRCEGNAHWGGGTRFVPSRRYDSLSVSHSDLPERMLDSGLNVLVLCGGTFTAPAGARIGCLTSAKIYRPSGYGGGGGYEGRVMTGSQGSYYYGPNLFIAAKKLSIDQDALQYGAKSADAFSGLCYLAGELS